MHDCSDSRELRSSTQWPTFNGSFSLAPWSGDQKHGINPILGPVSEPPFCGVRLYPTGAGSGGLLTDSNARVMHVRGRPIPGLYACGNAAAPTAYGAGYQAGLTLMGGMIFGYLAARCCVA